MSRRRTALVTAGLAAGAVAGGVVGRTVLARRRRRDPEAGEPLALLPPDDLGRAVSFDGTELAVRAAGDPSRPAVLFVHGFSLDMTTWHYQWTSLSERYRCVLFDQRSHGLSGAAAGGDLSLSAMGHDLAAVVEAAVKGDPAGRAGAAGRAVVVGHSMGGMAILAMAESRPDLFGSRVAGVVLVGTAASELVRGAMGSVTEILRPRLGSLSEAARRVNRLRRSILAGPTDLGALVARMTQFGPDASPHLVSHVVGLAARAPSEVWTDGLSALMEMDLHHALHHVNVPALVLVGEHDRVTPPATAVALAGELPDARLEIVERAGHIAMMERHEAVNEALGRFVEEVLEGAARRGSRVSARRGKRA